MTTTTQDPKTQKHLHNLVTRDMDSAEPNPGSRLDAYATTIPGGVSGYEPWYPNNTPFDSSIKRFISHFFEVSDDPGRDEEWVGMFREDATVMMGSEVAKGRDETRKLRRRMWKEVEARKHRLVKVFPGHFLPDGGVVSMHEKEFMLFGAVAYRTKKEGEADAVASWAGHAQVKRDGLTAPWRFAFYRVYIQR